MSASYVTISGNNIGFTKGGVSFLNTLGLYYAPAASDHNYKVLAWHTKGVQSLIVRCLWELQFPNQPMDARKVEVENEVGSEHIKAQAKNFWSVVCNAANFFRSELSSPFKQQQEPGDSYLNLENSISEIADESLRSELGTGMASLKKNVQAYFSKVKDLMAGFQETLVQNLRVDALFRAKIDGRPVSIIAEMERSGEEMGIRLLSYVCEVFSLMKVDVSKGIIPDPVYGFAFCFVESNSLRNICPLDTSCIDEHSDRSTQISICNVYLGAKESYMKEEERKRRLSDCRKSLKKRVIEFFKSEKSFSGGTFEQMSNTQKKVYLLMELMALSLLMTPGDVEETLSCLPEGDEDRDVFKQMYGYLKIKDESMSKANFDEKYPGLMDYISKFNDELSKLNNELEATKEREVSNLACDVSLQLFNYPDGGGGFFLSKDELDKLVSKEELRSRVVDRVLKGNSKIKSVDGGLRFDAPQNVTDRKL